MKTFKKLVIFVIIAAAIGGGVWYYYSNSTVTHYVYRTQPVTRGPITVSVSATGKVNPVETVEVGTQVSGTIKEIYADYNSVVKKGQLIALLDPDVLQSRVEEANASLALSKASVASAKASVTDATRSYKRNKELWDRNLIARSDLDTAETTLLVAKANLAQANAQVVQSQASLKQANTNLNYTKIYSPVDGVVISRQVDVGQTVAASMSTPTLFEIARDLTQMNIEGSVDEADIGRIAEGQKAVCKFDSWPKESFDGVVSQVRLAATTVSNVVTYTVVITIDNKDLKLKPGMTANVTIITEQRDDVLKVAAAALRFSPPTDAIPVDDSKKSSSSSSSSSSPLGMMPPRMRDSGQKNNSSEQKVWLVKNGQLVDSVSIGEQGASDRTWVEVIDSQLKEGDELAVSFSKETTGAVKPN